MDESRRRALMILKTEIEKLSRELLPSSREEVLDALDRLTRHIEAELRGAAPRRHHRVPEFYLERFANARAQVAMIGRGTTGRIVTSVRNAAVETDAFTLTTDEGASLYLIELMLADVDAEAALALGALCEERFPPTGTERQALSRFMALQLARSRTFVRRYEGLVDQLVKAVAQAALGTEGQIRQAMGAMGMEATDEQVARQLEFIRDTSRYSMRPHRNEVVRMMMASALDLLPMFTAMKWYLLRWNEPVLFTCDNPVTYWTEGLPEGQFYTTGPAMADVFRFPLDRRHALVLAWEGPEEHIRDGNEAEAAAIDANVLLTTEQWTFDHPSPGRLSPETLLGMDPQS